jgi:hypothetical protein
MAQVRSRCTCYVRPDALIMGNTHSYILAVILQDALVKYLRECRPYKLVLLLQMLNVNAAVVQAAS